MAKKYLSTHPGGGLSITTIGGDDPSGRKLAKTMFALSHDGSGMGTSFEDALLSMDPTITVLESIAKGIPGHYPLSCRECDEADLPAEQALRREEPTFRDAWEDTGTAVQVNMPKARVIHMDRIRAARDAELAQLDVAFMRELESGDVVEQERIIALKQALRNIPDTFDLSGADTPSSLNALWPPELPERT